MSETYNNYQNRFIQLANLKVNNLPENIEFEGDKFVIKPEFHITLLSVEKAASIIDKNKVDELKTEIVNEFYEFVNKFPLTKYELSDKLRLVNVNGNKTIVVMAKLEGIDKLFDRLGKKYGVELPVQPTHITLYTLPTDTFGIAINSYKELEEISRKVKVQDIQTLL